MTGNILLAFAAATALALVGTAVARRVALAVGFVDRPGPTKSHTSPVPYLGGVAIVGATLGGWLTDPRWSTQIAVFLVACVGIGLLGLVDDYRGLGPWVRLTVEAAAASVVAISGFRAYPFDVPALDIAITVLWIVGITNAFNLMDNADGLAGGTALGAAGGAMVVAAFGGQDALATATAAVAGACAGFLVYNWRPAKIFMGDAGALFLGFVLAVAVLDLRHVLGRPASFAVPLLFLGLLVLDTTMVMTGRFRHARSLMNGAKDHLSHRLVALGCSPSGAVIVLLAAQAALSTLAVLAARAVIPVALALLGGALVLGALAVAATRARVYEQAPVTIRSRLRVLVDRKPSSSRPVLQPAVEVEGSPGTDGRSGR